MGLEEWDLSSFSVRQSLVLKSTYPYLMVLFTSNSVICIYHTTSLLKIYSLVGNIK